MECTICYQEIKNLDPILKLECACNYFYHTECIEQWLNTVLNCPLCRAIVNRENLREAKYNPTLTIQEWTFVPPPPLPLPEEIPEIPQFQPTQTALNFNHPVNNIVYVYTQNYNVVRMYSGLTGIGFSN